MRNYFMIFRIMIKVLNNKKKIKIIFYKMNFKMKEVIAIQNPYLLLLAFLLMLGKNSLLNYKRKKILTSMK